MNAGVGWLLALGVLLAGGCSAGPATRVEPQERAQTSDEAVVLVYEVVATNAGESELPLRMVDYTLEIDGRRVFQGRRSAEATLSRQSEQRVELPVPVRWADVPPGEAPYRLYGRLGYTLPGIFMRAVFEAGLYRPSVGFEVRGTLDGSALRSGEAGPADDQTK